MFKSYSSLCDVVSLLAYSTDDMTCMLVKDAFGDYWLPHKQCDKTSWKACVTKMVFEHFGAQCQSKAELIQAMKVWLPNHKLRYIFHVVYKVGVGTSDKRRAMKPSTSAHRLHWLDSTMLEGLKVRDTFGTPELSHFLHIVLGEDVLAADFDALCEDEHCEFLKEVCEEEVTVGDVLINPGSTAAANTQLIQAAGYSRDDQLRLYREFVLMVYPSLYMGQQGFTQFLLDLGWQRQQCPALFRAADVTGRKGLTFLEFILWTAALEPHTEHRGIPAELRCRYIFRYFDTNRDLKLEYHEFQDFIATTRAARQLPIDALNVTKEADECFRQLELQPNSEIGLNDFLRGVGELRIRGTSSLLRAPRSIVGYITDLQTERDKDIKSTSVKGKSKLALPASTATRQSATASAMVVPSPSSTPPVRLSNSAPTASPVPLPPSHEGSAGSGSRGRRATATGRSDYSMAAFTVRLNSTDRNELLQLKEFNFETVSPSTVRLIMPAGEAPSLDVLGPESIPVEVLTAVHHFAGDYGERRESTVSSTNTPHGKAPFSWNSPNEEARMGTLLLKLAEATKPLFEQEPRLLKLNSPIYAVGDLHGNLKALLAIEKTLWPYGVALSPASILFLGDYVDRGPHGTELMAYLLAVKLQRPSGVSLIRGNHETRDIQKMFTFYNECICKYGESEGNKIWNAVNNVFDALPLAAVVDEKVFCCHGGIPPPWVCPLVSGIERVPVPLPRPAEQSTIAWELLWNDPIIPTKITGSLALELAKNEGFASNPKRGTGHVFDQIALDRFLLANHLSHVVRAHELHQHGFMMQMKGRLISVFSSSHYCGGTNDSGVAYMEGGKLRIIRVTHDTTNVQTPRNSLKPSQVKSNTSATKT